MQSSLHKLGPSPPCRLPVGPGRRWFATAQPNHQTLIGRYARRLKAITATAQTPGRRGGHSDESQTRAEARGIGHGNARVARKVPFGQSYESTQDRHGGDASDRPGQTFRVSWSTARCKLTRV